MKKFALIIFTLVILLSSCATLRRELSIDIQKSQLELNLAKIEAQVIPLEAMGGRETRSRSGELRTARLMIDEMEKEAAVGADYSAQLLAWSGRLAILEGKYSAALRLQTESRNKSPGNLPLIILGIRLEGDPNKRLEMIEKELSHIGFNRQAIGFGELHIEKASSLFELRSFADAAGAFDIAFASGINNVYFESYKNNRDRAWDLRAAGDSAGLLSTLDPGSLRWRDAINITKNETGLLRFITAGRDVSEAELMTRLSERGFIPYTQDITLDNWPVAVMSLNDPVLRCGAAWFVWHLHAQARADRSLLTRYSARYTTGLNPRSPITDLPVLSPFFDSILGCVETELMLLPDGRNFNPSGPVRPAELLSILKKIDN